MSFREWREKIEQPLRELLGRLTPAQRLSLVILAAVVIIGCGILIFTTPASAHMVSIRGSHTNADFAKLLEQNGIHYEIDDMGQYKVPESSLPVLWQHAEALGLEGQEPDYLAWLFDSINWQESAGQRQQKFEVSKIRMVQSSIARFQGVREAKVFLDKQNDMGMLRDLSGRSSAAIQLVLHPGVQSIEPRMARAIGDLVARAFNIPVKRITLSDQYGTEYPLNATSARLTEGRQKREKEIEQKVREHLESEFAPNQFTVSVSIDVDRKVTELTRAIYKEDDSVSLPSSHVEESSEGITDGAAPGTKPNVSPLNGVSRGAGGAGRTQKHTRSEDEYDNRFGSEQIKQTLPAGAEKRWSIVVRLSKPAVVEIIKHDREILGEKNHKWTEKELSKALDAYRADQEQLLRNVSSLPAERVSAKVYTFVPPERKPIAMASEPAGVGTFFEDHFREMALGFLALVAGLLLYRVAVRGIPEIEELPDPVAELERFLREKQGALAAQSAAVAEQAAEKPPIDWSAEEGDVESMALLEGISEFIQERPESAASVIRMWVRDGSGDLKRQEQES